MKKKVAGLTFCEDPVAATTGCGWIHSPRG
jgi:hypothetical protein